jgi:hypothetical protein
MSIDEISVYKMSIDEMSFGEMSVDEMTLCHAVATSDVIIWT